jgi:hypothetical protein
MHQFFLKRMLSMFEETPYNFTFLANPEQRLEKLKGTVPRDFRLQVFFHESVSPKPLSIQ